MKLGIVTRFLLLLLVAIPVYGQNRINLANPSQVRGVLASINGGTGVASPPAHQMPVSEGTNPFTFITPGSAGFCLTSNGINIDPSFQLCPGGTPVFPLTVTGTVNSGGIPCFTAPTLEVTSQTLLAGAFVIGGGSGNCPTATFTIVPSANGGTGVSSPTAHTVAVGEGSGVFTFLLPGSSGGCLLSNGNSSDPSFQPCPGGTPTFPVTVAGTVFSGGIPYFNSTIQESSSALLANHALVTGGGVGGAPSTGSGDFTYAVHTLSGASTGILDLSALSTTSGFKIPSAAGAISTADSFLAENTTNHTFVWGSNGTTIVGAAAATGTNVATTCSNQVLTAISAIAVPTCANVSNAMIAGPVSSPNGGTGVTSPTAHTVPIAEGASAFTFVSPGGVGLCLLSNGVFSDPTFQNCPSGFTNPMTTLGDSIYGGAAGAATRLTGPTSPNGVPQTWTDTPAFGAATAEAWLIPGVAIDTQVGTSYNIPVTDDAKFVTGSNSGATAWAGFSLSNNYVFSCENLNTGLITYTPASGQVNGGSTQIIPNKWFCFHYTDNTNTFMPVMPTIQAFPNTGSNAALTFTSATGAIGTLNSIVTGPGSSTNGDLASFNGTGGLTIQDSNVVAANVVTSSGTLTANVLLKGNGTKTAALSDLIESSNLLSNATTTQTWTITGGQDASANSGLGNLVVRGANETGAGGSSSAGGGVFLAGGANAATNASSYAGSIEILPGLSTGATQGLQGLLFEMVSYIKGTTVTQWNLECESGSMKVADCSASPLSWLGIAETVNSNTVQVAIPGGQTLVNASAAVTLGHTVCAGATAGAVTDSGGTNTCLNAQGSTVGVVMATSGTWTLPDGSSFTATSTLPLIQLIAGSTASGSFGTSPPACTAGTAGGICFTEGTAFTNVSGTAGIYADSTSHELEAKTNGSSSAGLLIREQPGAIKSTGLVAAVSTATLCASSAGACNTAGEYHVHLALYQTVACTSNATGGLTPTLTWTDGFGTAHSAQGIPMETNASLTALSGTMLWNASTLGAWASGDMNIDTNGSIIQYSIGFAQCSVSGSATYAADLVVTRLQ